MSTDLRIELANEAGMIGFGASIAPLLGPGVVLYLYGELGSGKTTLCRGILQAYGHTGAVKSPTYTLVEPYLIANREVYHFDLYRLGDAEELEFMGIRDYFDGSGLVLVEWPDRGRGILPPGDIIINIVVEGTARALTISPGSNRGAMIIDKLSVDGEPGTNHR